jgi:large subunit ribosomal protein L10
MDADIAPKTSGVPLAVAWLRCRVGRWWHLSGLEVARPDEASLHSDLGVRARVHGCKTEKEEQVDNPRPEKVATVEQVRSRLAESDAVLVTEYRGLKVKDLEALRRSLAPLGGEYRVYKNTLARIAASLAGADGFSELLSGPTGLAFVKGDAAAVAKALREFARSNPLLVVKGGLLGRSVLGAEAAASLADLPSREQLLARLAGALAAPLQGFAGALSALPRNFAYGLAALRDQRAGGRGDVPGEEPAG